MLLEERLKEIEQVLRSAREPVSGGELAGLTQVSRQIIVQDIGRLREKGLDIVSTPRGYILQNIHAISRVFKVFHDESDTEAELNLIVDQGAEVRDVFIYHRVYGEIHASLGIRSRREVKDFCESISTGKSSLLLNVTAGYHYHTVVAPNAEVMRLVEKELGDNGYLAPLTEYEPDVLTSQETI